MKHLVTGAGGMIGWALVESLLADGHEVRAVDILPFRDWQKVNPGAENWQLTDLRDAFNAKRATKGCQQVWSLAFAMGGIGFIEKNPYDCIESSAIAGHALRAAIDAGVERFFLSSSACAYSSVHQTNPDVTALSEDMVFPISPERGYGTAKWFDEEQCWAASEQYGIHTRIARYHNIYSGGPTTWKGGKEKAPAALCRKVAEAQLTGKNYIEVWGDGKATRSYCWIEDCVKATRALMESDYGLPVNIGSSELISVDDLAYLIADIAGIEIEIRHDLNGTQGVRGRNSDNTLCEKVLGWAPSTPLRTGLEHLYPWVLQQVKAGLDIS